MLQGAGYVRKFNGQLKWSIFGPHALKFCFSILLHFFQKADVESIAMGKRWITVEKRYIKYIEYMYTTFAFGCQTNGKIKGFLSGL
jgi:hypothetical protein